MAKRFTCWPRFRSISLSKTFEVDNTLIRNLEPYEAVAHRLQDHPDVQRLEEKLIHITFVGRKRYQDIPTPFVMLENSTGMGKTQMAFNLKARGQCEVFYIVCGASDKKDQSVYQPFLKRSSAFQVCVEQDAMDMTFANVEDFDDTFEHRYTYSFLAAALRGETTFEGKAPCSAVENALQERRDREAQPFVFYLDEFPFAGSEGKPISDEELDARDRQDRYLRAMRNVFLSFGLAVVISSTNGSGRGLPCGATWCRGFPPYVHCEVIPSLPVVVFDAVCLETVPDPLKRVLQHTRPLFAYDALTYIREHAVPGDLGDYFNKLVSWLGSRIRALKKPSDAFEWGQLGLLLCCDFSVADEYMNPIDAHFARLKPLEPFELVVDSSDRIWYKRELWEYRCACTCPVPE